MTKLLNKYRVGGILLLVRREINFEILLKYNTFLQYLVIKIKSKHRPTVLFLAYFPSINSIPKDKYEREFGIIIDNIYEICNENMNSDYIIFGDFNPPDFN